MASGEVSESTTDHNVDSVLRDEIRYYRDRAAYYDDTYARRGAYDRGPEANAAWQAELAVAKDALAEAGLRGDVLELGCGTGYWTGIVAGQARWVTAIDGAPEMLDVARERLATFHNVELVGEDIIDRWQPSRQWDAALACFFLEHVPDRRLPGLLRRLSDALIPGGVMFMAEGLFQGPTAETETRALAGESYQVIERRRTSRELSGHFAAVGIDLVVQPTGPRFCFGVGRKRLG